ncbi:MAG: hypothetical protein K8T10_20955 [Candidatus Eremiobacteraeota bacterium]|nr:hypothetical protein [Candidatus Eremiobacteraeota bacterium]
MSMAEGMLLDVCIRTKILLDKIDCRDIDLKDCAYDFKEIKKAIDSMLTEPSHLLKLADSYYTLGQMEKVLDIYEDMGETDNGEVLSRTGEIYMKMKAYDKAGAHFDKMIVMFEGDPSGWFNKANLYFESKTALEDSVFYLEKALELDSDYIDALILMAEVWLERSNKKKDRFIKRRMLKEAGECLDSAERQNDDEPSPLKELNLARIMSLRSKVDPDKKDEFEKASLEFLEKAMQVDEDMRPAIMEKIRQERAFEGLGLLMGEIMPEDEEEPGTDEDIGNISKEVESIESVSVEEIESGQTEDVVDVEVTEVTIEENIEEETIENSGSETKEKEEKEENDSLLEIDHILSPGDLIREGKEQIRRRNKKGKVSQIAMLRPDELD